VDDTTIINLSHLMALQKRFDLVANNIANSKTTGFPAQQPSFQEYLQPSKGQEIGVPNERPPSTRAAKLLKESQDATSLNQLANVPE
jgi:flagellar basal-body rod protein FlgF